MTAIQKFQEKVQKATERVEKCKGTIVRHEKQLEKKQQVLIKMGYDISDLEAIKWNKDKSGGSECYWEVWEVEKKLEDIKGAKQKLREAKRVQKNWQEKLDLEVEKERFLNDEAPQVIKDFLENWKQLAYGWYIKRFNDYQIFKKDLDAEAEKLEAELGIERHRFPTNAQKEILKEKGLDWESIKSRKANFAGTTILYMDTIYSIAERLEWLDNDLENEKRVKMLDLIHRINSVVGTISDASNLSVSDAGNLNGFIIGDKGKAKVETIGAGGYNIQCFHYRTLVNKIK